MNDAVRFLGLNSSKLISILPNAGLPQNEGGHAVYKLNPAELAQYQQRFVTEYGVSIVGGCCGTTPEHLKAVVDAVSGLDPVKREVKPTAAASSAYTSVPLDLDPKPLVVAEEMNTTTRVENFRNLVRGKKYDDILAMAKKLVNEGSHMLDLCCAIVGEDEKGYITSILEKIATRVSNESARAAAFRALNTASSVFAVTSRRILPRKFVSLYCEMPAPSKTLVKADWRFASTAWNEGPSPSAGFSDWPDGRDMRGFFSRM
jgi:hypothetical protein